jgi:hypothetical protein
MFLCIQGLTFLEPTVDKDNTCANLSEGHCGRLELILLLLLISSEYHFVD